MAKAMERVQNIQTGVTIISHHLRELPRRVPRLLQVNLLAQTMMMMRNLSLDPADTGDVFDISKVRFFFKSFDNKYCRKRKYNFDPRKYADIPKPYHPSAWLAESIPKKSPYFPQMGDEVMYFKQGHKGYIGTIR